MNRINAVLLIALLLSSVDLVRVSYEARRLYTELDRAQSEERLLDSQHEQLLSEKQSQATPLRVEKTAREKLNMRSATPAVTQYVSAARAASAAGGAPQ